MSSHGARVCRGGSGFHADEFDDVVQLEANRCRRLRGGSRSAGGFALAAAYRALLVDGPERLQLTFTVLCVAGAVMASS